MRPFLAMAMALVAGCGGSTDGAASPEDVFSAARTASENEDWEGLFGLMDPDERDATLLQMALLASYASIGKKGDEAKRTEEEIKTLLEKHHAREHKKSDKTPINDRNALKEAAKKMLTDVTHKPALFADLVRFIDKHAEKATPVKDQLTGTELKNVKIEGDRAAGAKTDSKGNASVARFVRRNDRWYISLEQ